MPNTHVVPPCIMSCNNPASAVQASTVLVCAAEEVAAGKGPVQALPGYGRICTAGGRAELEVQLCARQ